jgi:trehalose 6-phosphate phosphatase
MIISQARKLPTPPTDLLHGASLFLDFDGTLVAIAARPDAVAVERRLKCLLKLLLERLGGRLAIVSGRAAANIQSLLDTPALVIAGSHGAELCRPGEPAPARQTPLLDSRERASLRELASRHSGLLVEHKPAGLALHYRQAPEAEAECRAIAGQIAMRTGLALQPGKMVLELRLADADKGRAVEALLETAPLRGGRPIFIGDDDTDEAGFRAAAAAGGAGILVGEMRPTAASFRLLDVDATLAWLDAAARGCA